MLCPSQSAVLVTRHAKVSHSTQTGSTGIPESHHQGFKQLTCTRSNRGSNLASRGLSVPWHTPSPPLMPCITTCSAYPSRTTLGSLISWPPFWCEDDVARGDSAVCMGLLGSEEGDALAAATASTPACNVRKQGSGMYDCQAANDLFDEIRTSSKRSTRSTRYASGCAGWC